MTATIETERHGYFCRRHRGIIGVDVEVNEREALGLLRPNSGDRTTTILTLRKPLRTTRGLGRCYDLDTYADPIVIRNRIGCLPAELVLYGWLSSVRRSTKPRSTPGLGLKSTSRRQ